MDVKLIVAGGKNAGRAIPIPGDKFVIGRAADCHLRPNLDQISEHHCELLVEQGRVSVRDLNSATGTFVNNQQIADTRELRNGDHLRIGRLEFEVQWTVTLGGKKKPKIRSILEAAARTVAAARPKEVDVTAWLEEPSDSPDWPVGQTDPAPAEPVVEAKPEKPIKTTGDKEQAQQSPASSRDAAAEVLRKMFNQ